MIYSINLLIYSYWQWAMFLWLYSGLRTLPTLTCMPGNFHIILARLTPSVNAQMLRWVQQSWNIFCALIPHFFTIRCPPQCFRSDKNIDKRKLASNVCVCVWEMEKKDRSWYHGWWVTRDACFNCTCSKFLVFDQLSVNYVCLGLIVLCDSNNQKKGGVRDTRGIEWETRR